MTYADTQVVASGEPIWHYMRTAVENGVMPLPPVTISAADRDTLAAWLSAGAPARSGSDTCVAAVQLVDGGIAFDGEAPDSWGDNENADSNSPSIAAAPDGSEAVDSSPAGPVPGRSNVDASPVDPSPTQRD